MQAARTLACVVAVIACGVLIAGCNRKKDAASSEAKTASAQSLQALSSVTVATPAAPVTVTPDTGTPAPPCAPPRPHKAGAENATIESGGLQRTYILDVPPSYDGTRAMPLVLNLHGSGSNARQQSIYSGLPAKGSEAGFITVTPDGTGTPQSWTYPALAAARGVDDVAFIRDLLDKLENDLCVDEQRVFSAGISNGSAFSQVLACNLPGRFAAVAAVAALISQPRCADNAVALIAFHGTADPCVPFEGGQVQCGLGLTVIGVRDAAANWAAHDGCASTPLTEQVTEHVSRVSYGGCKDATAVVLYVIDGGGHTWPGAIDIQRLGATTHEISATDLIWDFFQQQGGLR